MVLESLINPVRAEHRPYQMIILGILYSSISIFLSLWIFYDYSSLVMVFLTVFACVPIVYNTVKLEERKDETRQKESTLLKEHAKALEAFMFLFLGIMISVVLWYLFLPALTGILHLPADTPNVLFSSQLETFNSINSGTGMAAQFGRFSLILFNNLKVLLFCILFSFIYGLGAIFILTWNATVIGVAIGKFISEGLAKITGSTALAKVTGYFQVFSIGFLRYSLHGVLEILAYFVGGLAGGIISVAVIRHRFGTKRFEQILWDSSDLVILSVVILIIAAFIEVFITPLVF